MNQNKPIDVLSSIEKIRIADNVFGKKSKEKLQAIVNEEYIRELLEEHIPKEVMEEIKGSYLEDISKYNKESIQTEIIDNIISAILKEAVTKAIRLNIEQLTDELIESVINYQLVWLAISEAKYKMTRVARFSRHEKGFTES